MFRTILLTGLVCAVGFTPDRLFAQPSTPPSSESARIDALIREGAINEAVIAFDAQADLARTVDKRQLETLAMAVLSDSTRAPDPAAALEACMTLLATGPHPCETTVTGSDRPDVGARLRKAALTRGTTPEAAARSVAQVASELTERDWPAAVNAAGSLPPAAAVPLLSQALANATPDLQYAALQRLAEIDDPLALPVLRAWSKRTETPGHFTALAALARSGDGDALTALQQELPALEGEDRLAAGVALAQNHDPRGIEAIREVLAGPDELLRVDAAAALARLGDKAGLEWIGGELGNSNVWIRLRALERLRGLRLTPTAAVWRQMTDPTPWVRVRAAQLTIEGCQQSHDAAALTR